MSWLNYLLEANLYLVIFYGFYLVFLQRDTFYELNRAFLIFASLCAFVIPFVTVGGFSQFMNGGGNLDLIYINPKLVGAPRDLSWFSLGETATTIYLGVAAYFAIKLLMSLYKIVSLAAKSRRARSGNIVYLELSSGETAFSFFNLLFINPSSMNKATILKHEMVHIQQKHSIDILFFELLRILNWFNPVVWLMQKDIKLLHEYIADDITTNNDVQKHEYAMFLIQNSFGLKPSYLTNQLFNSSILKRRINMLNRKRSAGRARLKLLLALPVLVGMLFASTVAFSKDYALIDLYPEQGEVPATPVSPNRAAQEPSVQQVRFYKLNHKMDPKGKRVIKYDNRLVVINGNSTQSGVIMKVEGFNKMVELNAREAKAKYGERGASGALEFTGKNTKTLALRDDVRFPPPIISKRVPPAPPAEPAPSSEVRFPPPIVKPNKKEVPPPPPPPVEPSTALPALKQADQG